MWRVAGGWHGLVRKAVSAIGSARPWVRDRGTRHFGSSALQPSTAGPDFMSLVRHREGCVPHWVTSAPHRAVSALYVEPPVLRFKSSALHTVLSAPHRESSALHAVSFAPHLGSSALHLKSSAPHLASSVLHWVSAALHPMPVSGAKRSKLRPITASFGRFGADGLSRVGSALRTIRRWTLRSFGRSLQVCVTSAGDHRGRRRLSRVAPPSPASSRPAGSGTAVTMRRWSSPGLVPRKKLTVRRSPVRV